MGIPLEEIAQVYTAAGRDGHPPVQAVASHFGRPRSTAGRWVMKARVAGLLPPTTPGRASGYINRDVVVVADALGIDAQDLAYAIDTYAGGNIRMTGTNRL